MRLPTPLAATVLLSGLTARALTSPQWRRWCSPNTATSSFGCQAKHSAAGICWASRPAGGQRRGDLARRLVAVLGLLGHHLAHHGAQARCHVGADRLDRNRLLQLVLEQLFGECAAGERHFPCQQEVERATEAIDVSAN